MSNKLKKRAVPYKAPIDVTNFSAQQISKLTGAKEESIKFWCSAREKEYEDFYTKQAQEELWIAEDYIAVANILISLLAIKMTWGYTKANQRFLENLNPAKEYLERNGVEKVYKELNEQMGIELEFDSMDINKEFGFGGAEK